MKRIIIKSILLFFSIPLINSITFGIGTWFHTIYQSKITTEQFASYQTSMIIMITLTAIVIPVLETLFHKSLISNKTTRLSYIGLLIIIAVITFDQFSFRPYEHSLTFLSIGSVLFTRELFSKNLNLNFPKLA